jgi:hypothetical protein
MLEVSFFAAAVAGFFWSFFVWALPVHDSRASATSQEATKSSIFIILGLDQYTSNTPESDLVWHRHKHTPTPKRSLRLCACPPELFTQAGLCVQFYFKFASIQKSPHGQEKQDLPVRVPK